LLKFSFFKEKHMISEIQTSSLLTRYYIEARNYENQKTNRTWLAVTGGLATTASIAGNIVTYSVLGTTGPLLWVITALGMLALGTSAGQTWALAQVYAEEATRLEASNDEISLEEVTIQ